VKRAVLWDSSAILAFLDADDVNHAKAGKVLGRLANERRSVFVTNYLVVETHALLLRRLGRTLARRWLLEAKPPVLKVTSSEEAMAVELLVQFEDKDWSLCDAISFAVMLQRKVRSAFSFDHHFGQIGRFEVLGLG
jgi:uncharacterized protein